MRRVEAEPLDYTRVMLALLLALLAATPAAPVVGCEGCAPLPAGRKLPASCPAAGPVVVGVSSAGPAEPGVGRFVEDLWVGVAGSLAYALLPDGRCLGLGSLSALAGWGARLETEVIDAPHPLIQVSAQGRRGACAWRRESFVLARLPGTAQWTHLAHLSEAEERCGEQENERRRELLSARGRGAAAARRGEAATAEQALLGALPLPEAAADLGALLLESGRLAQAEPLLWYALARGAPANKPFDSLELLYDRQGRPELALEFRRRRLRRASDGVRAGGPEPRFRFCTDELVRGEAPDAGAAPPAGPR